MMRTCYRRPSLSKKTIWLRTCNARKKSARKSRQHTDRPKNTNRLLLPRNMYNQKHQCMFFCCGLLYLNGAVTEQLYDSEVFFGVLIFLECVARPIGMFSFSFDIWSWSCRHTTLQNRKGTKEDQNVTCFRRHPNTRITYRLQRENRFACTGQNLPSFIMTEYNAFETTVSKEQCQCCRIIWMK